MSLVARPEQNNCFPVCVKFLVRLYPCERCAEGFSELRHLFLINFMFKKAAAFQQAQDFHYQMVSVILSRSYQADVCSSAHFSDLVCF